MTGAVSLHIHHWMHKDFSSKANEMLTNVQSDISGASYCLGSTKQHELSLELCSRGINSNIFYTRGLIIHTDIRFTSMPSQVTVLGSQIKHGVGIYSNKCEIMVSDNHVGTIYSAIYIN